MRALAACLYAALVCVLFASSSLAQDQASLELSANVIEVGQTVRVVAQAMSSGDAPESPELTAPPAFAQHGPSIGTNHQISIVNGRMERKVGISATWELTARRVGKYTIGPATFQTANGKLRSTTATIEVVAVGQLPAPQRARRRSIFDDDFFPGFGRRRSIFDDLFGQPQAMPEAPAEYRVDRAPDQHAFLRAVVSSDRVVLGQQVTLDVYAYGSRGGFQEMDPREPRRSDFFSYALVENSGKQRRYSLQIEGRDYQAVLIRRFALFPLKTGDLEIGPMSINFYGNGYVTRSTPEGLPRTSNPVVVHVAEAPPIGRPTDYQSGDVGRFTLTAQVQPRSVEAGGSFSVVATLEGIGNLPSRLVTPEQTGLEWLEPSLQEERDADENFRLRGKRTFTYVVKAARPGTFDLGDLRLPFYDPTSGRYSVAKAALGKVHVTEPTTTAQQEDAVEPERTLTETMTVRTEFGSTPTVSAPLSSQRWYWLLLFGAPLSVVAIQLTGRAAKGLVRRVHERRDAPSRRVDEAFDEARKLLAKDDAKGAASALERALFLGIELKTGLRGRGMLRPELTAALVRLGTNDTDASEIERLFSALDELRFASGSVRAPELVTRGRQALARIVVNKRSAARSSNTTAGERG